MPDYGLWQQIGTMDKLDEYKLTMPMIDEEWIMEKWMIHYGQLWRCQWNTEWWLNLPVSLRNYVFDLRDSVSEATLFFLGFWEVLVIKQYYMYIVMCIYCIYFITPAWLESAPMYCVTVLFLASRQCHVVGIQVVQLRRSWALNVPLSCADCSASRTARATEWVKTWDLGTEERWTEPPWVLLFCSWVNVHMGASENWTCLPNRCKYSMSEEMSKISSENEDS